MQPQPPEPKLFCYWGKKPAGNVQLKLASSFITTPAYLGIYLVPVVPKGNPISNRRLHAACTTTKMPPTTSIINAACGTKKG